MMRVARDGDAPQLDPTRDGTGEVPRDAPLGNDVPISSFFRFFSFFSSCRLRFCARRDALRAGAKDAPAFAVGEVRVILRFACRGLPGTGVALGPADGLSLAGASNVGKCDGEGRPRACWLASVNLDGDLPGPGAPGTMVLARDGDTGQRLLLFLSFRPRARWGLPLPLELGALRRLRLFLISTPGVEMGDTDRNRNTD